MATLADIRARLQASENNKGDNSNFTGDNAAYPFWNIPEQSTATIRFLPDADESNHFFWVERNVIKLPFAGILGDANSSKTEVRVPCMELWGETCPVLTEIRPWFNDPALSDQAHSYWKKRSYIFNGMVVDSQYAEENTPDNPIRRFVIGPQIFAIIKAALMDPEIDHLPTDVVNGLDFRLTKTEKGGFNDYSTSTWARKERPLSAEEQAAIEEHGLHTLSEFLPKKPSEIEVGVIKDMFEDSVDGLPYDAEKYSNYYRPFGYKMDGSSTDAPSTDAPKSTKAKAPEKVDGPADVTNSGSKKNAQDILKQIRDRDTA